MKIKTIMSDIEIIESVRQNNPIGYQTVYDDKRFVMGMVIKRGGTFEEAEDVFHNGLLVFLDKIKCENFVLTCKLRTFLCGIVTNMWKKEYEKRKRFASEVKDDRTSLTTVFNDENHHLVNSCLAELTKRESAIIRKVYFEDKTMEEIVAELGYSTTDSAKNLKCRAMRKLEKIVIGKYDRDDFYYN